MIRELEAKGLLYRVIDDESENFHIEKPQLNSEKVQVLSAGGRIIDPPAI